MRLRLLALALAAMVCGCGALKDVMTLASSLEQQYHRPVNVNIQNGSHLTITLQGGKEDAASDSATSAELAHEVAAYAMHHYAHPESLEEITVAFASVSSAGPVTVTRTAAPYTFTAAELK